MKNTGDKILRSLRRFFSTARKQDESGKRIYKQWFDSFDDSGGYLNRLDREERERYKRKVFRSLEKKLPVYSQNPGNFYSVKRTGRWKVIVNLAAILIAGAILSVAGLYYSGAFKENTPTAQMVQKSNPVGQISEITLPDGSKVWLSAASRLEYPEEFPKTERAIYLEGEAYFEVDNDPDRPFTVYSGPLKTRVLGTSFNIKAYQNDPDMHVTLATGEVEITTAEGNRKHVLSPNQQIRYTPSGGVSDIQEVDASLVNAWTRQELVFIRESFETIAKTFERWYDVEFIFEDEALKKEIFVHHFKELSLQNSMIILQQLADFEYRIDQRKVIISETEP